MFCYINRQTKFCWEGIYWSTIPNLASYSDTVVGTQILHNIALHILSDSNRENTPWPICVFETPFSEWAYPTRSSSLQSSYTVSLTPSRGPSTNSPSGEIHCKSKIKGEKNNTKHGNVCLFLVVLPHSNSISVIS